MLSWEQPYIDLATEFDGILSDAPNDIKHLAAARLVIIDLNSEGLGPIASARLLPKIDLLYRTALRNHNYYETRDLMVSLINQFTIEYFGDLTTFVNALAWPDGCIPYYWAVLSATDHSVDTSEWNICIS